MMSRRKRIWVACAGSTHIAQGDLQSMSNKAVDRWLSISQYNWDAPQGAGVKIDVGAETLGCLNTPPLSPIKAAFPGKIARA